MTTNPSYSQHNTDSEASDSSDFASPGTLVAFARRWLARGRAWPPVDPTGSFQHSVGLDSADLGRNAQCGLTMLAVFRGPADQLHLRAVIDGLVWRLVLAELFMESGEPPVLTPLSELGLGPIHLPEHIERLLAEALHLLR